MSIQDECIKKKMTEFTSQVVRKSVQQFIDDKTYHAHIASKTDEINSCDDMVKLSRALALTYSIVDKLPDSFVGCTGRFLIFRTGQAGRTRTGID